MTPTSELITRMMLYNVISLVSGHVVFLVDNITGVVLCCSFHKKCDTKCDTNCLKPPLNKKRKIYPLIVNVNQYNCPKYMLSFTHIKTCGCVEHVINDRYTFPLQ